MIFLASQCQNLVPSFLSNAFHAKGAGPWSWGCCSSTCSGTSSIKKENQNTYFQAKTTYNDTWFCSSRTKSTLPVGVSSMSKTLAGHFFTSFSASTSYTSFKRTTYAIKFKDTYQGVTIKSCHTEKPRGVKAMLKALSPQEASDTKQ